MKERRGQIGTEYLVIIGFVIFVIISVLGLSLIYASDIKDVIRINEVEQFSEKIVTSAEKVFFAGEPSKIEITAYLPEGVTDITISGKELVVTVETSTGTNVMLFPSKVNLDGEIPVTSGVKIIKLEAGYNDVLITVL